MKLSTKEKILREWLEERNTKTPVAWTCNLVWERLGQLKAKSKAVMRELIAAEFGPDIGRF